MMEEHLGSVFGTKAAQRVHQTVSVRSGAKTGNSPARLDILEQSSIIMRLQGLISRFGHRGASWVLPIVGVRIVPDVLSGLLRALITIQDWQAVSWMKVETDERS